MTTRPLRIGCGAGYSGDRIEPAVELVERANLDAIVFASSELAVAGRARAALAADKHVFVDGALASGSAEADELVLDPGGRGERAERDHGAGGAPALPRLRLGLDRVQPIWGSIDGPAINIHERQLGPDYFAAVAIADATCSWHLFAP